MPGNGSNAGSYLSWISCYTHCTHKCNLAAADGLTLHGSGAAGTVSIKGEEPSSTGKNKT